MRAVALSVGVEHRTCMVYSVGDSTPESVADLVIKFVPAVEWSGKMLSLPEDYRRLIAES